MLDDGETHIYLLHRRQQLDAGLGGRDGHRPRRLPALRRHPRRGHEPGTFAYYQAKPRDARFSVVDTECGTSYGVYRPAEDDTYYWRIAPPAVPLLRHDPDRHPRARGPLPRLRADGRRPHDGVDDHHVGAATALGRDSARLCRRRSRGAPGLPAQQAPAGSTAAASKQNAGNDFLIDRELQKSGESYSGIRGIRQQDMAVTGSMGTIYDRTHEHLGTTDALIIRTRRRMITAAKALRDEGITPPGVDNPEIYRAALRRRHPAPHRRLVGGHGGPASRLRRPAGAGADGDAGQRVAPRIVRSIRRGGSRTAPTCVSCRSPR